jgi:hypothetical protein
LIGVFGSRTWFLPCRGTSKPSRLVGAGRGVPDGVADGVADGAAVGEPVGGAVGATEPLGAAVIDGVGVADGVGLGVGVGRPGVMDSVGPGVRSDPHSYPARAPPCRNSQARTTTPNTAAPPKISER